MHTGRPPGAAVVREPPCGIVWFRKGVCYGMWQRKLGLGLFDSFRLSVPEQLQAFALVGFDAFFSDDNDPEQRALPAEELGAYLQRFGKPVTVCPDPAQAAARALAQAGEDDVICAVGSLYMAGAIRTYLRRKYDENSGH